MISLDLTKTMIVGTGPAGLMAATVAARAGHCVRIIEKRTGPGRKLLVAGSSGLNVASECADEELLAAYTGEAAFHRRVFRQLSPKQWLEFIQELGLEIFLGTSRRWFVREMKASGLLKAWVDYLKTLGVEFVLGTEVVGFGRTDSGVTLACRSGAQELELRADSVCFALGGGSWEPKEKPLRWPRMFAEHHVEFSPFISSNVGFKVAWPAALLKEAEGSPIKNIVLSSSRGSRQGDLMITAYGIEGTPVYTVGIEGPVAIDLKPDLTREDIARRLAAVRENLSPLRRIQKVLRLSKGAEGLLYHMGDLKQIELGSGDQKWQAVADRIKAFPLLLQDRQPLDEAISSSGGVALCELDEFMMLNKCPGVFLAGEMLDWDAPTGGFLVQACAAQGWSAGMGIAQYQLGANKKA